MDYIKKLLQALLDTLVPPGTIIMYGGSEVPDGYILIQNVKVYEDEFPRLYPVLAACSELEKGNDSGRAWVKMPNPDGRVPQFTTSGSLVWKLLEAALPNIQGDVWNVPAQNKDYAEDGLSVSGCFNKGRSETVGYVNEYADGIDGFVFKASKANATYGGNTVQSPAIQALACIKI